MLKEERTTAEEINKSGGIAKFQKISVTDKVAIEAAMKAIFDTYGKIDILINNAGIKQDKSLGKISKDECDAFISITIKNEVRKSEVIFLKLNKNGKSKITLAVFSSLGAFPKLQTSS